MKTYLKTIYDTRKSFYNKAVVEITNNEIILFSYNTKIATINKTGDSITIANNDKMISINLLTYLSYIIIYQNKI